MANEEGVSGWWKIAIELVIFDFTFDNYTIVMLIPDDRIVRTS